GYTGTITFSSGDPAGATLPADYPFTLADGGMHTFAGLTTLYTPGTWDVTVNDLASGLTGTINVNVISGNAPTGGSTPPGGRQADMPPTSADPDSISLLLRDRDRTDLRKDPSDPGE